MGGIFRELLNRSKQIDILRAITVILVLIHHMKIVPVDQGATLNGINKILVQGGWSGVDIFFVLSGFLVSGLLFREYEKYQDIRVVHFLIRRGFKIYPPFWCLIAVTVLYNLVMHIAMSWHSIVYELIFVQNYMVGLWNHTWSLAVEEHFYFLLSILLLWMCRGGGKKPFRPIPYVFVGVALVCLLFRIRNSTTAFQVSKHLFPSHLRLDALFFGVVLAYWYHFFPKRFLEISNRFRFLLIIIGVLLFLPVFWLARETNPMVLTYGLVLLYLGSGCLLAGFLGFEGRWGAFGTALAFIGSHSYSIYLWHMPMIRWGNEAVAAWLGHEPGWFTYAGISIFGSILFGIAMATLIEIPTLRLRDRLFPSRGRALAVGEAPAGAESPAK